MTRLFDALSKARSAHPVCNPVAPLVRSATSSAPPPQLTIASAPRVRPATAFTPPVPMKAVPAAVEWPTASDDGARRIVALDGLAELPTDVVREMTGLRISLEVALTQRIPRTVMFIASQGGEGTSTLAAQFAQSLASDERLRVLLVDAHVRRPAYEPDGSIHAPDGTLRQPAAEAAP